MKVENFFDDYAENVKNNDYDYYTGIIECGSLPNIFETIIDFVDDKDTRIVLLANLLFLSDRLKLVDEILTDEQREKLS